MKNSSIIIRSSLFVPLKYVCIVKIKSSSFSFIFCEKARSVNDSHAIQNRAHRSGRQI